MTGVNELLIGLVAGALECRVFHPREQNIKYMICGDCVHYIKYGQLDDQTMLDLDKEVTG